LAERADVVRNRARILDAAKRVFADPRMPHGPETVARLAGVGIGTLYRHFPNAEALAAAVYEDELARVADAVDDLIATLSPPSALRAWMDRFAERMAGKRAMSDALRSVLRGDERVVATRIRLAAGVQRILDAGAADGSLRPDTSADDLIAALVGVTIATAEDEARAARLMDLLVRGVVAS